MNIWQKLGNTIREARMNHGMSQEYLAEILNVTPTHIRHVESSHRKPSIELLFQVCSLLNISLDALLFGSDSNNPPIHTDGLSAEEIAAIARITDLMRKKESGDDISE